MRYPLHYGVAQEHLSSAHSAIVALGHVGRTRPVPYDVKLARVEIHLVGFRWEEILRGV